ncbi:hypothetical protein R1sor_000292 [Riccia sorocarpa]|uniref:Uncharacterized protein n=1 Tax=Riccia sorocarpa TaxID=122646 RepID=A0ABD3GVX1_9MARC
MIQSGQFMPALRWACMKPMSPYRVEKIWQACTAPESVSITDVDHILYGRSDNDRYWNSMNPMELMLADARERQLHAGYNLKPPAVEDDDNDNAEHDVADPDGDSRPELGTNEAADPMAEVPVIDLTNAPEMDTADNEDHHNEEGERDEIQPDSEKPPEQSLPAFIDLTGINDIYDMEENRPASAEEVTAAPVNVMDATMKEKQHQNTEASESVPQVHHSDAAIDKEHDRRLPCSGEEQLPTETKGEQQNVPAQQVPVTTDMEGIDINSLDIVDLQTMVPPDMDSQLLTNDFLQMGYAVRRPRTDHIPDVDPRMRIRRILEVKRRHEEQTSKAPDLKSQWQLQSAAASGIHNSYTGGSDRCTV